MKKNDKELKIKLNDWDHTCGDGCCYTWGTTVIINGEELDSVEMSTSNEVESGLKLILEHLGYKVEIDYE